MPSKVPLSRSVNPPPITVIAPVVLLALVRIKVLAPALTKLTEPPRSPAKVPLAALVVSVPLPVTEPAEPP